MIFFLGVLVGKVDIRLSHPDVSLSQFQLDLVTIVDVNPEH